MTVTEQQGLMGFAKCADWAYPKSPPAAPIDTSRVARRRGRENAARLKGKVLECLRKATQSTMGGLTDEELFARLPDHSENSIRPRRVALMHSGRVRDSHTTRATKSGRLAKVWKCVIACQS